jgi:hypothetical protein
VDILPYGSIGLILPSRLFVEDRFIEEDEILCDILSHLLSLGLTQVFTAAKRDPAKLLLGPFPSLQHPRDRGLVDEHTTLTPEPKDDLVLAVPSLYKQELQHSFFVSSSKISRSSKFAKTRCLNIAVSQEAVRLVVHR